MAFGFRRVFLISATVAVAGAAAASALVPDGLGRGASEISAAAYVESREPAGAVVEAAENRAGRVADLAGETTLIPQTDEGRGRILLDNYENTFVGATGATFDVAQGFTTGAGIFELTEVELGTRRPAQNSTMSVVISEPTGTGQPGTTLYVLETPSDLLGRPFFKAPENVRLEPNTSYLVRIAVTAGSVGLEFTTDKTETDEGLSGWTFEDHFWTSSGSVQGTDWTTDDTQVVALTLWGQVPEDDFGEDSFTSGHLRFNRHSGESPRVSGLINPADDADWFNTSLEFDNGGRYRIDVEPVSLTDDDDLEVRAFYLDNPHHSSGVVEVEVESVSDPPEGFVSWHFVAERNFGPYIEVCGGGRDHRGVQDTGGLRPGPDLDRHGGGTRRPVSQRHHLGDRNGGRRRNGHGRVPLLRGSRLVRRGIG